MDKNYWEAFYAKQNALIKPSLFAIYVMEYVKAEGLSLIELGCGNGRDAIYFATKGLVVSAIDQCEQEINTLNKDNANLSNLKFICNDFSKLDDGKAFDMIYSRFTLHSVTIEQEQTVIEWAYRNLNQNGAFCIEVRGQKNEIYQLGTPVEGENDAFIYDNHYRRFLNFERLCSDLSKQGFELEYSAEEKGFAPYNNADETFIRVIARKK
ncbi:MAG: class I SAM-dependent methyltransferase [Prolixibacteraceae bacterium]